MSTRTKRTHFEVEVTERNKKLFLNSVLDAEDDQKRGCFLKTDLEYQPKTHRKTKLFPFSPEKKNTKAKAFFPII